MAPIEQQLTLKASTLHPQPFRRRHLGLLEAASILILLVRPLQLHSPDGSNQGVRQPSTPSAPACSILPYGQPNPQLIAGPFCSSCALILLDGVAQVAAPMNCSLQETWCGRDGLHL